MIIKQLLDEDFINYKKPSMFIGFPTCTWKCEKDCKMKGLCQNGSLANSPTFEISKEDIVKRYIDNPISKAVVFGGLEPFDSWEDLANLVAEFRRHTSDDIVIYTGYYEMEIVHDIEYLRQNYDNIIVKFGRFIPNKEKVYDEILGVNLASDNQYGERIC
jgi:organic radical activating enzyme